jgi:alkylhydroperoxidase family enzyme
MADIRQGREAAIKRILEGEGHASREDRTAAFEGAGPDKARVLVDMVTTAAAKIGDDDIATARKAGYTEDQIFELVVCAAMGQASRQYENALAALAEATKEGA